MALRIISAAEPIRVETIVLTVYAPPGVGKTSLGFSAHAPLLLDTDKGAYRSAFRRDTVQPDSWEEIAGITAADVKGYDTLVLDTAGRALDLLATDIIRREPKLGRGGALTLQGYGKLKVEFTAYLKLMRSFGLDIVLIAHSDEKQQGDDVIERIDMQGGSKQEVYKSTDAMARLSVTAGRRVLTFSPTETQFGKDPAGIGRVEVPDLSAEPEFLGDLIDRIKLALNEGSAVQQAAAEAARQWADKCRSAATPEALTALIPEAGDDRRAKTALLDAATAKGFTYDKDAGAFVGQPATARPSSTPPRQQATQVADSPPITERQMKRFWAIAKGVGYTDDAVRRMLADRFQIESASEITRDIYEAACEAAEDAEAADYYAHDPAQVEMMAGSKP